MLKQPLLWFHHVHLQKHSTPRFFFFFPSCSYFLPTCGLPFWGGATHSWTPHFSLCRVRLVDVVWRPESLKAPRRSGIFRAKVGGLSERWGEQHRTRKDGKKGMVWSGSRFLIWVRSLELEAFSKDLPIQFLVARPYMSAASAWASGSCSFNLAVW